MSIEGFYYLHENGSLIYKRALPGTAEDLSDSTFVRAWWPCDPTERQSAWTIVLESLARGAAVDRVRELASRWSCDARDFTEFLRRTTNPSAELRKGGRMFLEQIVGVDSDVFYDWLATTPNGGDPNFNTMPVPVAVAQ